MAAPPETSAPRPADALLRTIAEATAGVAGEEFLRSLATQLASSFGAECAYVAELVAPERARVLVSTDTRLREGLELDAAGPSEAHVAVELIGAAGAPVGHIGLLARGRLELGADERSVLEIFAARAAAEVERRRGEAALHERESELTASRARVVQAGDEERRRIGRDLHDGTQQRLVALGQFVDVARRKLEQGDAEEASRLLVMAREQVAEAGAELRALAGGLHPVALERGLEPALGSLAMRSTLRLDVAALPDRRLPEVIEATIWFVVAEALSNAVKHAGATTVRVAVELDGRSVRMTVADDGAGGADAEAGTGLLGLAARVEALGGRLEVDSPAGAGTRLEATIPVAPWRTAREPFLEFGHPGDGGLGELLLAEVLAGERTAAISFAREWDLEGGPPRPGHRLPVLDHAGVRRAAVEVTRVAVLRFDEIDEDVIATQGAQPLTMDEWHARQRRLYAAVRDEVALLLGEPGWRLTGDEPMAVVHFRLLEP
ncbi:MAG TPA: histidine kinase [Solirubrobacteraceae bacterium]|nr:histidine kinase [Solirubrobacteraceae bacterium]